MTLSLQEIVSDLVKRTGDPDLIAAIENLEAITLETQAKEAAERIDRENRRATIEI